MQPEPTDYIAALEIQRNAALNEVVNLRAENAALRRQLETFCQNAPDLSAASARPIAVPGDRP